MKKEFDITRKNEYNRKSFRVAQIFDQFDLKDENLGEHFKGEFDFPDEWNIGVIVGKSGTGKTTIAKELFGDTICNFEYKEKSVVDDFDKSIPFSEITSVLSSVGFSSPPSWIKPYNVLSNGEKMRVDLARAILADKDIVSFDEFTSVVDREVAKLGSFAVQKAVRKRNKKFIAISCHYDILEWLEPDWVFCTDDMSFKMTRGLLRRPEIKLDIRRTRGYWKYFSKYHYLSHNYRNNALEFVAFYKEKACALIAFGSYPHPVYNKMWLVHRIVVLPDYQGLGIAQQLLNFGCSYVKKNKNSNYISLVTSLKLFARNVYKYNHNFVLVSEGRQRGKNKNLKHLDKSSSKDRNTYSFKYVGK